MGQLIRTFHQQNHLNNQHHEISLRRSGCFLYIESMISRDPMMDWRGESGVLYAVLARKLFAELRDRHYKKGALIEPFKMEADIVHGAMISRYTLNGSPVYDVCTDIETVSLYFRGHRCLESFISDLEGCLSWAA